MTTTGYKRAATVSAILFVLIAGSQTAWGQRPKIQFKEESFDLGVLQEGEKVQHLFEFVNAGDAPLTIFQTFGD